MILFDLLSASPRERDVYNCGEWWGFLRGIEAGRRQAEDESEASWQTMVDVLRSGRRLSWLTPDERFAPSAEYLRTARHVPTFEQCRASWDVAR